MQLGFMVVVVEERKMLKSFKTEIHPTTDQIIQINKTIGVCRFIYNQFISYNRTNYENGGKFISGYEFDKYVNIILSKEFPWIKEVSSKSRKQSIMNAETAFKKFFKKLAKFPKFKKKRGRVSS